MASVTLRFYAELNDLLAPERRGKEFAHPLPPGGGSVKDLIEGLGVPHTEVDLVLVDGEPADLGRKLTGGERIAVYPMFEALDISGASLVRSRPLRHLRFAVDVHLGRLAAYLRLAGFDTLYRNDWDDAELVDAALAEQRIILTRDRRLLMRAAVTHGYLVRHTGPRQQLAEVLDRFDLWDSLAFLSLCSVCNSPVREVAKTEVAEKLLPGTAATYERFWRCGGCGRIYWQGAHYRSLCELVEQKRQGTPG